jgi:hypothetical protein
MASGALFIGWGHVIHGREQQALHVFNEAVQYWSSLQQGGEIEGFEPVALEPHGGDLHGFFMIRGDREQLARLRIREDFVRLIQRAELVVADVGVVSAYVGDELNRLFSDFQQQAAEIAR